MATSRKKGCEWKKGKKGRENEEGEEEDGGARDRRAGKCGRGERKKVKGNDEKGKKGASETRQWGRVPRTDPRC